MSEKSLVLNMLAEGKINQEEAEQLLEAMGEMVDLDKFEASEEKDTEASLEEFLQASDKLDPQNRVEKNDLKEFKNLSLETDSDLQWLYVKTFAGNIKLKGDDALTEPKIIDGEKYLLDIVDGVYMVKPIKTKTSNNAESILGGLVNFIDNLGNNSAGDLEMAVPKSFGVKLKSGAGNLKAKNIEFLNARLMAGNVKVTKVSGLAINTAAGDIDVTMLAGAYDNRIKAAAGNIDLKLLSGSDTAINAKISVGELSHTGFDESADFDLKSGLVSSKLSAIVGEGSSNFDIKLSAGNLDLELEQ